MARRYVVAGSASQSFDVFLQDRTSGDGVITLTTDKVKAQYVAGTTGPVTTIALVGTNTTSVYASGAWCERSSTLMPGVYRLDVPDAAIATTPSVTFFIQCSTAGSNFIPVAFDVQVVSSAGDDMPSNVFKYKGQTQTSRDIGADLNTIINKVTSIEANTTAIVTKVTSIDTNTTALIIKLTSVNTNVDSVLTKVTSIDTNTTALVIKLTSVDTNVTSILNKVTSIEANTTGMVTRLSSVNTNVDSVLTKVTSIDANTTALVIKATSINTNVDAVLTKATSVETKLDGVVTKVSSIDTKATAIQAQTTQFVFTQAGNVDANIQYVNDVAVQGTGTTVDTWRPV